MDKPKRACELIFKMEGNTKQDIISGLKNFLYQAECEPFTNGLSCGVDSSVVYSFTQNDNPTKEQYFADLRTYLDNLKGVKSDG